MRRHETMVVVDVELLGVAEVPAQLAGVSRGHGNNVANLDGVSHLKHQAGRDPIVRTCVRAWNSKRNSKSKFIC